MTKNPFVNALAAVSYIVAVASLMFYAPVLFGDIEPSILIPIGVLSLFVFSAAMMGFIFLYQPLTLFLEGEKKESMTLFLKTVVSFAVLAGAVVSIGVFLTRSFGVV